MLVKCQLCGTQLDKKDVVRFEEKNYHAHCAEEMNFKMKIYSYVAQLFKFKNERKPGPVIMSQLKNFMEKYQYTYNGIYHTLVYCYDVKKMSIVKAKEGIGIVPYLYEEAQEYFKNFYKKQQVIVDSIKEQLEIEPTQMVIKKKESKKTKIVYNLDDLIPVEREEKKGNNDCS